MYNEPLVESSFSESNIGATIFNYTLKLKPTVILEVGALNGYSSLCFIQALKTLNSIHSKLITIDLFDDYPYNNCSLDSYCRNVSHLDGKSCDINHKIIKSNVMSDLSLFDYYAKKADLIFIDISNDFDNLSSLLARCSVPVIFEGGSVQRDSVSWMINYKKTPINHLREVGFDYQVIDKRFPSLSIYYPLTKA